MIARILSVAIVLSLAIVTPAAADGFYLHWADGTFTYVDMEDVLLLVILVVSFLLLAVCLIIIEEEEKRKKAAYLSGPLIESYHQNADRIRAMAAKIDAEAQLAESYINAMRTRALIEELPEILQHDRAMRRR